jgi:hypothetical protein
MTARFTGAAFRRTASGGSYETGQETMMSQQQALTAAQQKLNDLWEAHLRTEF